MEVDLEEQTEIQAMQRYLDPTNDVAFKRIFSHKDRIMDFLNAILSKYIESEIIDLAFIPNEEVPDVGQGKRSVMDLRVQCSNGNIYIVEMQNRYDPEFINRMQYYGAHSLVSQLKSGDTAGKLTPVILVAVLNHKIFPEDVPYISYHRICEYETGETYLDRLAYLCIELEKFNKTTDELNGFQDEWLHFLSKSSDEKIVPDTIHDKAVIEAYNEIERFNWTPGQYDAYVRVWMEIDREKCAMEKKYRTGKVEGMVEGIELGKAKATSQNARRMLADGISLEKIALYTGLSPAEIEKLHNSL
jgi:predicted transposase/invertase (TIGR01784 family)